tara:strand:- start:6148 stop:8085 length:1938 start_codon:yes stop_codon:yes gene_type:complete
MIKSIINPSLSYRETTQISDNDIGLENVQTYEVKLLDVALYVILGSIDKTYEADNVVFTPIYIINPSNNKVTKQIGRYEFNADDLEEHKDQSDANQLVLDTLHKKIPLIFSFVTKTFLQPFSIPIQKDEKPKSKTPDQQDGVEEMKHDATEPPEDSKSDANKSEDKRKEDSMQLDDEYGNETFKLKEKYLQNKIDWVVFYFNDSNFAIQENDGDGDCFFLAIQQAYVFDGKTRSIQELRNIVADNFTEEIFNAYKDHAQQYDLRITKHRDEMKTIMDDIARVTSQLELASKTETRQSISDELDKLYKTKTRIKTDISDAVEEKRAEMLNPESYLQMISHFSSFKDFVQEIRKPKGKYWADENAISILEQNLNIKFIIFEKPEERQKNDIISDPDKMVPIVCGYGNDNKVTAPENYIVIQKSGAHYELIKHNNKGLFSFTDLPNIVKDKLVNKCLEQKTSGFHDIADFRNYLNDRIKKNPPTPHNIPEESHDSPSSSQDALNSCIDGLCDDAVQFTFYHKSSDKPPGKGNNESIPPSKVADYNDLKKLKHWRRILSDNHTDPNMIITVNGTTYDSIHEFTKSKKKDKGSYQDALLSKFRDNDALYFKDILLATKNAKLLQHVHRAEPIFSKDLMLLRNKLKGAIHS